jgi:hypothetical protein
MCSTSKASNWPTTIGKFLLTVHLRRRDLFIWVEQAQAAPAKQLVEQVNHAIATARAQASGK